MVVLDADSVMSGECLTTLVRLMEANPNAGIIQTAPRGAGRDSLYARVQQFASRVYGPMFTAGLHFWQLGESHYWGHNAIIRVAPFMGHCALARLPGRGPLAGEILTHDFVEAALMRRAGWAVWIAYDLGGSYEEMPPNLLEELKRDRRWCQGNLINSRLFLVEGLHPAHRALFLTGVFAYVSALLWFLFLALSTALLAVHTLVEPAVLLEPRQLFPHWPEWRRRLGDGAVRARRPRCCSCRRCSARSWYWRAAPGRFGGACGLTVSVLLEMLFSACWRRSACCSTRSSCCRAARLRGRVEVARRARTRRRRWREACARHGLHTLLGLGWGGVVYWLKPSYLGGCCRSSARCSLAIPDLGAVEPGVARAARCAARGCSSSPRSHGRRRSCGGRVWASSGRPQCPASWTRWPTRISMPWSAGPRAAGPARRRTWCAKPSSRASKGSPCSRRRPC